MDDLDAGGAEEKHHEDVLDEPRKREFAEEHMLFDPVLVPVRRDVRDQQGDEDTEDQRDGVRADDVFGDVAPRTLGLCVTQRFHLFEWM